MEGELPTWPGRHLRSKEGEQLGGRGEVEEKGSGHICIRAHLHPGKLYRKQQVKGVSSPKAWARLSHGSGLATLGSLHPRPGGSYPAWLLSSRGSAGPRGRAAAFSGWCHLGDLCAGAGGAGSGSCRHRAQGSVTRWLQASTDTAGLHLVEEHTHRASPSVLLATSLEGWGGGSFLGKVDTVSTAMAGGQIDRRVEAGPGRTQRDPRDARDGVERRGLGSGGHIVQNLGSEVIEEIWKLQSEELPAAGIRRWAAGGLQLLQGARWGPDSWVRDGEFGGGSG